MPKKKDTSWEAVAGWYDKLLEGEGTYQKELILPNLLRIMDILRTDVVLDLACGQGFFAHEFARKSGHVIGVDASKALIAIATKNAVSGAAFRVAPSHELSFIKDGSIDKVAIVLALQNIEDIAATLHECARVLRKGGMLYIIMNHPAFRVPKQSSWGWDEAAKVQYRRIDKYLSESKVGIQMHPGDKPGQYTITFHRPLQFYFKAFNKAGFMISLMEEWNSHKKSQEGPRSAAEDVARKEIPLFICIGAVKS